MSKSLRGSRSSKEASVVLSSVTVVARELDTDGAPTGEERNLGSLAVSKENGTVTLTTPVGGEEVGDGWQVLLREHGRDSQTHQVKVYFADAVVVDPDPEPTPDTTKPSTPANLRATGITETSFRLDWNAATDDVGVVGYRFKIDDDPVTPTTATTVTVIRPARGDTYATKVWALDAAGNQSEVPATLTVTTLTPPPDPDPEPEPPTTGTWPAAGTVGFKGDRATLRDTRSRQVRTAGTVIQNERIDCSDGELGIYASNVTIRNCVIDAGIWGIFLYNSGANLVVEDCTFVGGYQAAIGLSQAKNWRVSRCDFSGGRDAVKPGGSGVIEDCRMHDPDTGGDAHNDCLQFSNTDGVVVRRNYLAGADTSCIAMFDGQGTYKNVTIENNYLGGAGYAIYAGGRTGSNIRILNNTFGSWGYQHPVTDWVRKAGNEFVGNKTVAGVEVKQP